MIIYKTLVRKPEMKRSLGRPRYRWDGDIEMHIFKAGRGDVDWTHMIEYGTYKTAEFFD
jgi:hypothetical protein